MESINWCKRGGSRGYVTTTQVNWDVGKKGSSWTLKIPPGTEFESSVPRGLHWLFSPDDPHFLKSALIHDRLLETGCRFWFSDSQWFEAALSEQAPLKKAIPAYLGMIARRFSQWAMGAINV